MTDSTYDPAATRAAVLAAIEQCVAALGAIDGFAGVHAMLEDAGTSSTMRAWDEGRICDALFRSRQELTQLAERITLAVVKRGMA